MKPENFAKIYNHPSVEAAKRTSRPAVFFAFPEIYENPTNLVWYPYLIMFIRLWLYGLGLKHAAELKTILDFIPFIGS